MEFRKVFDTIPEKFDKWRPRYCNEVFKDVIKYSQLDSRKSALEIGPGTGQATEPILKTNCNYLAIELGKNLAEYTENKLKKYDNFHILNADFETYDFGRQKFELIYSAATIQWIPEKIGFSKTFSLLKSGGTFAMMLTKSDYKTPNEALYNEIEEVYDQYFRPESLYSQKIDYNNVANYGFVDFQRREYYSKREFNADGYVSYLGTHCDHIVLKEPYKSKFYEGVRDAVLKAGNKITFNDTIVLYLTRKP
jgi:trans-aconitate methyltransferase